MTTTIETIKEKLEFRLDQWKAGEIQWNVSNQFDETVLESALENLNNKTITILNTVFSEPEHIHVMDLAHFLSSFEASELDSAWID